MTTKLKLILVTIAACVLVACGGGGGGGAGAVDAPGPQGPKLLGTGFDPDVAVNANGVGYAAWEERVGDNFAVFSSTFREGRWAPAQRISRDDGAPVQAVNVEIVVLPNGEALAVWQQDAPPSTAEAIMFSRTDGGVWKEATLLQTAVFEISDLKLVADGQGNAAVIWRQTDVQNGPRTIQAAVFGFGAEAFLPTETISLNGAHSPDIAIDTNGNALAVWVQRNNNTGFDTIRARPYAAGGDWGEEVEINPGEGLNSRIPRVAVGVNGAASVVWERDFADGVRLRKASNFLAGNWANTIDLNGAATALKPEVVLDHLGITTVVWLQIVGGGQEQLVFSRGEDVLSPAEKLENINPPQSAEAHQLAVDAAGRVMAVWTRDEGESFITQISRLDPATGKWGAPYRIESEDVSHIAVPALAMNAGSLALVVWVQGALLPSFNIKADAFQ